MEKKKVICSIAYFLILFTILAVAARNEYISTALIINLWFSIPMAIGYFIELYCFKKALSNIAYFLIAIVNTIILFISLCFVGEYLLYAALSNIPF